MTMHAEHASGKVLDPAELLRDELTIQRLSSAVDDVAELRLLGYDATWWDGQAHTPCLVVESGATGDRHRVVETAGLALVVPFRRRRAKRELAARRLPRRPEIGVPPQRQDNEVVIDATVDAVRCSSAQCGALRPVVDDACPLCGSR